jgi:uncharacterized membrane protein
MVRKDSRISEGELKMSCSLLEFIGAIFLILLIILFVIGIFVLLWWAVWTIGVYFSLPLAVIIAIFIIVVLK